MSGFDISPASLRQSADGVVNVVDRIAEAVTKLETTLQGYGQPWGTGLVGSVLGEIYLGIHDMAIGSYEANAEVMSEYAEGLDGMADQLQELEAEIESGFVDIGSQLSQGFPKTGP
jgi:hypothetical protein